MKNLQSIRQAVSKGAIFLLLAVFLLPASCAKEEALIEEEPDNDVDYNNLAAYFSGMEHTLFVLPEHVESVLNTLGADVTSTETLLMVYPNYKDEWVPTTFKITTVNAQESLIEIAINTRQATEEILAFDATATSKPMDSQTYFNSTCVSVPEKYGTCHVIGNQSSITYKYPRRKCKSEGTGNCIEFLSLGWSQTRTYQNRNCSGNFTVVETNEWVCR
jgi:hypothetical protein